MKIGDEFYRAIAVWACHFGFDELKPKKNNISVPEDLINYRNALRTGSNFSMSKDFWVREDISKWVDNEKWTETENRNNLAWLNDLSTWLNPDEDIEYLVMLRDRIFEFEQFLNFREAPRIVSKAPSKPVVELFSGGNTADG